MTTQNDRDPMHIRVAPGLRAELARLHKGSGNPTVYMSDEIRERLRHFHRIGLLPTRALKEIVDKPKDLRCTVVSGWLRASQTARADHLAMVFRACEKLAHDASERIPISDEMIEYLRYQERRTGVNLPALLGRMEKLPYGLSRYSPVTWMDGSVHTVQEHVYDFVVEALQRLPNRQPEPAHPTTYRG